MDRRGVRLGAIADDFTGATDLASILARSGQPVSLRLGVPTEPPVDPSPYEVIALKIRTSPAGQAAAEALAALEWLQAAGAERYFWKYWILSGSTSQMSSAQVAAYCATGAPATRLDPRALASTGISAARQWLGDQDLGRAPLVYSTAEPESVRSIQRDLGRTRAAALVEAALADCARDAVAAGARRIVVAGGETAGAVTGVLGVARLELGPEIAPGVPTPLPSSPATSAPRPSSRML